MTLPLPGSFANISSTELSDLPKYETITVGNTRTASGTISVTDSDTVTKIVDNVSPRVKGRLKLRENGFSRTRQRAKTTVYHRRYEYRTKSTTPSYVVKTQIDRKVLDLNTSLFDLERVNTLRSGVQQKARVKLDQEIANANIGVATIFLERKSTIEMVLKRVHALGTSLETAARVARRLSYGSAKTVFFRGRPMTQLSRYWLEFWFGWFPVLMDIDTLLSHERTHETRDVHAYYQDSFSRDLDIGGLRVVCDVVVKCKMKAVLTVNDPALVTLKEYGLLNPLHVAWELITLSWLVDYFLQLGPWLFSLSASAGLSVSGTSQTVSTTMKATSISSLPPSDMTTYVASSQVDQLGSFERFEKLRTNVLTTVDPLFFTSDLSLKQSLNTLALLFSRLRRL